jgi:hypothetical protein
MRFSRHAKNNMRLYGIARHDAQSVVSVESQVDADEDGNPIFVRRVNGRLLCLVLALDDMNTVITVYDLEA